MGKKNSILILLTINILIVLTGIAFSVSSNIFNVSFLVFNTSVAGYVLGLVVVFLGVRYFKSLKRLWVNISSTDADFSWNNFRKSNTNIKG